MTSHFTGTTRKKKVAVIIASKLTNCAICAYPWRDGQTELAWVAGYVMRQLTCPKAVTIPLGSMLSNCVTNALPLH